MVVLFTASCATVPERDAISMTKSPPQWSTVNSFNNPIATQWISAFNDPELSALVQAALNNNYDLKAAAARVDSAREQMRIDGAPRWPQLFFVPGYRRDVDTGAFEALFTMSWEIDVWGRIKATQQAAWQEADAVAADYHGAKLSLAARTAMAWPHCGDELKGSHLNYWRWKAMALRASLPPNRRTFWSA